MNLTHTTHAGYIRQDDVYTDENGVKHYIENYIPEAESTQLETLF